MLLTSGSQGLQALLDEPDEREECVRAQAASGLSVAEYCRRHDLCPATFYNWRRRSREGGLPGGGMAFTEIGRLGALQTPWAAEITLASGTVVRVNANADAQLLRALLEVVG